MTASSRSQGVSNRKVRARLQQQHAVHPFPTSGSGRSVRYLIDKNAMTEALGGGTVMTGPLSPLDDGYQKTDETFGHDIGKGNDLIKYSVSASPDDR